MQTLTFGLIAAPQHICQHFFSDHSLCDVFGVGYSLESGDALPHSLSSQGDSEMEKDTKRTEVHCLGPTESN